MSLPRSTESWQTRGFDFSKRRKRSTTSQADIDAREIAKGNLLDFTVYTNSKYRVNWHHKVLCHYLDQLLDGSGGFNRLMVFMPPRHGKSELVSRRLPAYALGQNPDLQVISCSYGASLASRMNRDVQRIIDTATYRELFPETRLYGKNIRAVADGSYLRNSDIFEIVDHSGVYVSAGIGGGITGMGFHLGIIDDPIKHQKEADSKTFRDGLWEWYTSTFWTRQEEDAKILITLTRWHEDDLAGRILKLAEKNRDAEQWKVLRLPGLCEDPNDPCEQERASICDEPVREVGEPLWPKKRDRKFFAAAKANNTRQHEAINQQNPKPREGGMFQGLKAEIIQTPPAQFDMLVRWWDLAATEDAGAFTAGVLMGRKDGIYYVLHVIRRQYQDAKRDRLIRAQAYLDRRRWGHVNVWGPQDPGQAGKSGAKAFVKNLSGFTAATEQESGDKAQRAEPFASQWNAGGKEAHGNVKLLEGEWNADYIEEIESFPYGTFKDQVDASANAFNKIALDYEEDPEIQWLDI